MAAGASYPGLPAFGRHPKPAPCPCRCRRPETTAQAQPHTAGAATAGTGPTSVRPYHGLPIMSIRPGAPAACSGSATDSGAPLAVSEDPSEACCGSASCARPFRALFRLRGRCICQSLHACIIRCGWVIFSAAQHAFLFPAPGAAASTAAMPTELFTDRTLWITGIHSTCRKPDSR